MQLLTLPRIIHPKRCIEKVPVALVQHSSKIVRSSSGSRQHLYQKHRSNNDLLFKGHRNALRECFYPRHKGTEIRPRFFVRTLPTTLWIRHIVAIFIALQISISTRDTGKRDKRATIARFPGVTTVLLRDRL